MLTLTDHECVFHIKVSFLSTHLANVEKFKHFQNEKKRYCNMSFFISKLLHILDLETNKFLWMKLNLVTAGNGRLD